MDKNIRLYLAKIGSLGGKKSRRVLPSETARNMVCLREAKRAFKKFHASCFWSFDPYYPISVSDIPWIINELRKNGGRSAWDAAAHLCR